MAAADAGFERTTSDDWDPRSAEALADPFGTWDRMRRTCPVAHSDYLGHSVFRHADVMRVLEDHATFSNAASSHVSVPNSMDPPEHTPYRRMIDAYFTPERVAAFEPSCRRIAARLVAALPDTGETEVMFALGHPYAVAIQCAFLGWPDALHAPLIDWVQRKNEATLSGDKARILAVAGEFDATIRQLLAARRATEAAGDDVTGRLMRETIDGQPLPDEAIVSILRNWTVGEVGTIASSVGIIAHFLAGHPDIQQRLRGHPDEVWAANDEILRIHAPLIANRRRTTCPVRLGGRQLQADERVTVMWAAANRDEAVFVDPDEFRLDRDPALNLLYGAGVHQCPGRGLARMELVAVIQQLLADGVILAPVTDRAPELSIYPASGFRTLPLHVRKVSSGTAA